eukprot:GHUV01044446.1.p1 GENE.GHUV01044446.1~~GHUV01044446.1.p1  ORF type:complete len:151 (+),score=28.32 GHUV01044446.1:147-599(+)
MHCFTAPRLLKQTRIHTGVRSQNFHSHCCIVYHLHRTFQARTTVSAAENSSSSTSTNLTTDWEARRKQRVVRDLVEGSKRLGPHYTADAIREGVDTLESLLPGLQIDVEAMKARDWVSPDSTEICYLSSCSTRQSASCTCSSSSSSSTTG